jgi:hypothetical protein
MKRERRSLWGSISTSKKVNALSDRALILYVLAISHLDDEGFIDGDPRVLKSTVVPLRDNIQIKDMNTLTDEISTVHTRVQSTPIPLWMVHKTSQGTFIQDPVFNERQSFKGIRKIPSKIKDVVDMETNGKQNDNIDETKGCVRVREGKEEEKSKGSEVAHESTQVSSGNKRVSPEELKNLFNTCTHFLPKVTELGKTRTAKIRTRIKEGKDILEYWRVVFVKADNILIPGKDGKKDWFPNFDWLIENENNARKVFEGNYDDAKRSQSPGKTFEAGELWEKIKREEDERKRSDTIPETHGEGKRQLAFSKANVG